MMKKTLMMTGLLLCLTATAQEVDKGKVQAQANAAADAQKGLKEVDTGEKVWKISGVTGLNAAATGLVNWAAGGNNNVNGVVFARLRALYHKEKVAWDTNLDMEYGLSYVDQPQDKLQKSSDALKLSSKVGYEFAKNWYATGLIGFNTQFALGREYKGLNEDNPIISKFMAPAYTDISVGIDWKPNKIFSLYLSPIAGRLTTVAVSRSLNREYEELYPQEHGGLEQALKEKYGVWKYDDDNQKSYTANTRAELGFSLKGQLNYSYKDLKLTSSLGLYTPYACDKTLIPASENNSCIYRDNNRRIGNFDVDWDLALSYQLLKCLQMSFTSSLKYYNGVMIADKETGYGTERVQFKTVLGIGVGYSF
ncbi:MAG: DUF3078 domain-containing protein [Bacteroidales bacterium]|nr:DUF3078 domain-containing protein [Candidatus Physcousia equi]